MDDSMWLQVQMPFGELQPFLDNSPFAKTKLRSNDPYCLSHFDQFIRSPPTNYRGGQQQLPNARVINIAIDESDDQYVIVYMQWHET
jgi:hypothetical protein